jgi:hypothetical protein
MQTNEIINKSKNKWHNVYWFSRMLINNDKYVAIGKEPKLLSTLASRLRLIVKENKNNDTLSLQKQTLRDIIEERYKKTASKGLRVNRLSNDLEAEINTPEDMNVFILTCENIMLPLHHAISKIPSDDKEFTLHIAKSHLDIQGNQGLATVISLWTEANIKKHIMTIIELIKHVSF